MPVEDGFATDGVQGSVGGPDPMGLAAAEPQPSLFVQIAEIPYPVPETAALRIMYFGQPVLLLVVVIGPGHHRAAGHDLAHRADRNLQVVAPCRNRAVRGFDHPDSDAGQWPAHADSPSLLGQRPGGGENLGTAHRHNR